MGGEATWRGQDRPHDWKTHKPTSNQSILFNVVFYVISSQWVQNWKCTDMIQNLCFVVVNGTETQPMTSDVSSHKKDEGEKKEPMCLMKNFEMAKQANVKKTLRLSVSILSTPRCMR